MKNLRLIPDIQRQQTTIKANYAFIKEYDCIYRHLSNEQFVLTRYSQNAKKVYTKEKVTVNAP